MFWCLARRADLASSAVRSRAASGANSGRRRAAAVLGGGVGSHGRSIEVHIDDGRLNGLGVDSGFWVSMATSMDAGNVATRRGTPRLWRKISVTAAGSNTFFCGSRQPSCDGRGSQSPLLAEGPELNAHADALRQGVMLWLRDTVAQGRLADENQGEGAFAVHVVWVNRRSLRESCRAADGLRRPAGLCVWASCGNA